MEKFWSLSKLAPWWWSKFLISDLLLKLRERLVVFVFVREFWRMRIDLFIISKR